MPEPAPRPPRPWREHWPVLMLALAATVVAVASKHLLFPALSWNRDEPVYLWHVELLRAGRLTGPDGGYPELFLPWLSLARDGALVTQYTLGWPLTLLAARLATGTAAAALPVGAALAVVGTYALAVELFDRRRVATLAGALVVASPILAIQGGVHLSYLFTLGLGLCFGALLLSGFRRGRPLRLLAAATLVGWIFLTRPYDALLWGAAFAGYLLVVERHRWLAVVRSVALVVAAALPFVVAALAYNRHVTGSWTEFPITAADPLDSFGFGTKRLMPGFDTFDYTPGEALRATAKNAFLVPWFLAGGYAGLGLALWGLWTGRRERPTLALALVGLVFPLGYLVFWGNHLSSMAARISGPIYFIPLYAPLCILLALVLVRWWAAHRHLTIFAVVVLATLTAPVAWSRLEVNRAISRAQEPWRTSVADLEGPALVLVADTGRYLLYTNPFGTNGPDLDDAVLYASLLHPSALALVADQPERALWIQRGSVASPELGPREDPYDLAVALVPATVVAAPTVRVEVAVTAPPGVAEVWVELSTGVDRLRRAVPVVDAIGRLTVDVHGGDGPGLRAGPADLLVATAGWGDRPQVRQRLLHRSTGDQVEVLTPGLVERYQLLVDHHEWRHAPTATDLAVEVHAGP